MEFFQLQSHKMHSKIATLYKAPYTIFTYRDVAWLWGERHSIRLKDKVAYYVKRGDLIRLTRGIFAKPVAAGSPVAKYDPLELAGKLANNQTGPSYVSFETALMAAGIKHFQGKKLTWSDLRRQTTIFVAARRSKIAQIDGRTFVFRKLKNRIIFNRSGLVARNRWAMAGPERAFLDTLYLHQHYAFDQVAKLDWAKCFRLAPLYGNQQLMRRLKRYYRAYNEPIKLSKKGKSWLDT